MGRRPVLERRPAGIRLHYRNLALFRNNEQFSSLEHADNRVSIRGLHHLLDTLHTFPVYPSGEVQDTIPTDINLLWRCHGMYDDLGTCNGKGRGPPVDHR